MKRMLNQKAFVFETRLKHVWNCLKPNVFETKEKVFICVWNANRCYICQQWTKLLLSQQIISAENALSNFPFNLFLKSTLLF